jgi:hypothetical protein
MTAESMAILQRHMSSAEDAPAPAPVAVAAPAEAAAPVVTLSSWRRRVPVVAAGVAAGVAMLAGATQLIPQAAVTTRNVAANGSPSTVHVTAAPTSVGPTLPTGVATTVGTPATADGAAPEVTTTSTSTTILPALPCVGDLLRDLGGRTGLRTTPTTQNAPGVLPCP